MTAPRDPDSTPRAPRLGDSTRAIRAASRTPEVVQRPPSIPIFQTATFTSADAESLAAVAGDARVVHPPSTSQRQLTEAELLASGIRPGLLRVSVGLEDVEDLVADFDRALAVARQVAASGGTRGGTSGGTSAPAPAPGATPVAAPAVAARIDR